MDRLTPEEILRHPEYYQKNGFRNGIWRARVVSVNDPESRGRVQVRILQLHPESAPVGSNLDAPSVSAGNILGAPGEGVPDDLCPWAEPCFPFGGALAAGEIADKTQGSIMIPEVGSTVWVGFDMGFTGRPVWLGAWLGQGELPVEFTSPEFVRLIKTPAGHLILFDDTPGAEKILLAESTATEGAPRVRFLQFDKTLGTATLQAGSEQGVPGIDLAKLELNGLLAGAESARLQVGPDTFLLLQRQLVSLQAGATTFALNPATGIITLTTGIQTLLLDLNTNQVRLQNGPDVDITLTLNAVTIRAGTNVIVVDNATGTTTITNTGNVSIVTPGNVSLAAGGLVDLGLGGTNVLIEAFLTLFNAHTHLDSTPAPTGPPIVPAVTGVHSSASVKAKL
jgi:hypothetical protein